MSTVAEAPTGEFEFQTGAGWMREKRRAYPVTRAIENNKIEYFMTHDRLRRHATATQTYL